MHASGFGYKRSHTVRGFMKIVITNSKRARLRGLLFRKEFADMLLLQPCNDIHTIGMTRPIDIAFITPEGIVLESHRSVGPFRRLRCEAAYATLERFASQDRWYERGDIVDLE